MTTLAHADGEWRARVLHAFRSHLRSERQAIDDYRRVVQQATDPGTRFLLEQILADEQRHHELFRAMTDDGVVVQSGATSSLSVPDPSPGEAAELLDATSRFLAAEREDREQLRRLRRELAVAGKDSIWSLVVELMEIDTAKHIRILEDLWTRLRDRQADRPPHTAAALRLHGGIHGDQIESSRANRGRSSVGSRAASNPGPNVPPAPVRWPIRGPLGGVQDA